MNKSHEITKLGTKEKHKQTKYYLEDNYVNATLWLPISNMDFSPGRL